MALPGRLTQVHIDALEKSGEGKMFYLHRWWTLEELKELAGETDRGNGGTDKEPSETTKLRSTGDQVGDADVAEHGSDSRQTEPHSRKKPDAGSS